MAADEEPPQASPEWAAWLDAEMARGLDDDPETDVAVGPAVDDVAAAKRSRAGAPPVAPIVRPQDATLPPATPPHSTDPLDSTDPGGIPDPGRPPLRAAAALAGPNVEPTAGTKRKRLSRWDRPPEPHDWRWVVGHIGRALITVGLLMFGFVAYQLWGTGIQTARAQHELKDDFEDRREALPAPPDTIAPAPTTTAAAPPPTTAPVDTVVATTTTLPPVTTTTVPAPIDQDYGIVHDGDGLGEIKIPEIGVDFIYIAGVSRDDLNRGVGHFPKSVVPGQLGNAALAGHRTSHKAPFNELDELDPGDEIEIYTILGGAYLYVVTGSEVVEPSDYHVVTDSDPTKATLTLITCTPEYTSKQRLVIHAELDVARSSPAGVGEVYYGEVTPDPSLASSGDLPGDDGAQPGGTATTVAAATSTTVMSATSTIPAEGVPTTEAVLATTAEPTATTGSADGGAVGGGATTTPTTAPLAAGGSVIDVEDEFDEDAFEQGWFDDSAALPHVFGWGALLALVWYGAYQLAKRYRRLWLGALVGLAPFVVVLYFWYENINRLLPATL